MYPACLCGSVTAGLDGIPYGQTTHPPLKASKCGDGIVNGSQMWLRLRVELDRYENRDRYKYLFSSKMI